MNAVFSLVLALVLLMGCKSPKDTVDDTIDQSPSDSHVPGLRTNQTIDIFGEQREYHVYLPENPATAPIVLLLHGNRGSSDQILGLNGVKAPNKLWQPIALRENLILLVPNGSVGPEGHQGWNDCRTDAVGNPDTDDVLFITKLVESISTEHKRTEIKVFSVGVSNGGMMSMRLADEVPELLHAFASVVSSRPINTKCPDASVPVSALIMNGTDDPILPYAGGQIVPNRGELYSTEAAVDYWVNRNQTSTALDLVELENTDTNDDSTVKVYSYTDGINNTRVMHYEIVGGGHTEPSIAERYSPLYKLVVGEQNNDFEIAEEIWRFFDSL